MLKHGIINPLNVHGLRRLTFCPPHFDRMYFDLKTSEKKIVLWVLENLQGRFFFSDVLIDAQIKKCIAFEEASEIMVFGLQLDIINTIEPYK
jgi:hypothetical protein